MPAVRSHLYDDKTHEILANAAKLIAEQGYGLTSMSQIAQSCSSSKARIYHYFESKEQILFEIVSRHINILLANYKQAVIGKESPKERLLVVIQTILDMFESFPNQHKVFLKELDKLPPDMHASVLETQKEMVALVKVALMEIRPSRGRKRNANYAATAMLFLGMVNWTYTWFDHQGSITGDALCGYIFDLFFQGYEEAPFV